MKINDIIEQIKQVELIADTQATLVQRAGASVAHTEMVLKEIVERCKAIESPNSINKRPIEEHMAKFFEGTVALCEATSFEQHSIWKDFCHDPEGPQVSWKQDGGYGITVGYLDNRPVHVSFMPVEVAGFKIMFLDITSAVVDHDMVRKWVEEHMPEGVPTNIGNAMNFSNCLPSGWRGTA